MSTGLRIDDVLAEENIRKAIKHMVQRNTGCGYDGMYAGELAAFWERNGTEIKEKIRNRSYVPVVAVQVRLRKLNGEFRILEIPTVRDRMLQYALCNVMTPLYENVFSSRSYGFRPGRSTLDAVAQCLTEMNEGKRYVADLDIRKYFDSINQRMLMQKLGEDIRDESVLELIRAYLGMAVHSRHNVYRKVRGVVQGGPLSPLLANIFLHQLDSFLEEKRISFVRYADDIVLLCHSQLEAEAALKITERYLYDEMQLRLNRQKTKLIEAGDLHFLGYGFQVRSGVMEAVIGEKDILKMQTAMRRHLQRRGESGEEWWDRLGAFNRGWINYYRLVPEDVLAGYVSEMEKLEEKGINERIVWHEKELMEALWDSRGYISPCAWYGEVRNKGWMD